MTLLGSYCVTGDVLGINIKEDKIVLQPTNFSGSSSTNPTTDPSQTDASSINVSYGDTFTISGLQITVFDCFEICKITSEYSDNYNKDAVKINFTFKNTTSSSYDIFTFYLSL